MLGLLAFGEYVKQGALDPGFKARGLRAPLGQPSEQHEYRAALQRPAAAGCASVVISVSAVRMLSA